MRPSVGRCSPMISRSSTDLPVPLPPISATSVPRATLKLTPSCTRLRAEAGDDAVDFDDGVVARHHQMPSSW